MTNIRVLTRDEIPYYAKECGWEFDFDIPSDNPDDYYYIHNNTEVQQAWDETIDLAIKYLNTTYPDITISIKEYTQDVR